MTWPANSIRELIVRQDEDLDRQAIRPGLVSHGQIEACIISRYRRSSDIGMNDEFLRLECARAQQQDQEHAAASDGTQQNASGSAHE